MKLIRQIIVISLVLTAPLSHADIEGASLAATQIISTNDLKQGSDGAYTVVGEDPYWVFRLTADNATVDSLWLNMTGIHSSTSEHLSMEVFVRGIDGVDGLVFDPRYRIKLQVNQAQLRAADGKLRIPLDPSLNAAAWSLIRIDINGCQNCRIQFADAPKLLNSKLLDDGSALAKIVRLYQGSRDVEPTAVLSDPSDWRSNDIERSAQGLRIAGEDPYLISPILDVGTATLGGVQFSLRAPADVQNANFQLFYATDTHRFIEAASSFVKIPTLGEWQQFVIPLNFLASEAPAAQVLEQLRLDFDSNSAGNWELGEVRLIGLTEFSQLSAQVPARILQRKLQRASGFRLVKKALKKVIADLGFSLSYLLLLVLIIVGFRRAYKQ